jgi:signal recognition particle subunit SEC65
MSDSIEEFEDEIQTEVTRDPVRAQLRKVEQQLKAAEAKAKELETAARELAFVKAGVDVNAPIAKYFVKGYDGELSADAIRVAAQEANLIQAAQQQEKVQPAEQQAWARVNSASQAGEKFEPVTDWATKMSSAKNQQELDQLMAQYNAEMAKNQF